MATLKERTETLYFELKDYVEAFEKKNKEIKKSAFKGKVDNIELFDEKEIMDTAYDVFQSKTLHHLDVMLLELNFINTYKNTLILDPETSFEDEIKNAFNAIVKKHQYFYVLEKEGTFKALDENKIETAKTNFRQQIEQVGGLDFITEQLEKELKT